MRQLSTYNFYITLQSFGTNILFSVHLVVVLKKLRHADNFITMVSYEKCFSSKLLGNQKGTCGSAQTHKQYEACAYFFSNYCKLSGIQHTFSNIYKETYFITGQKESWFS